MRETREQRKKTLEEGFRSSGTESLTKEHVSIPEVGDDPVHLRTDPVGLPSVGLRRPHMATPYASSVTSPFTL